MTDSSPATPNTHDLVVRRLEVDLRDGFDRHWNGGDAFLSQYMNALSMSFPVGEQSFIDAVRDGAKLLPDDAQHAALKKTASQFIGQEATHRHLHTLYNKQLEEQGLVNNWQHRAAARLENARKRLLDPRHFLAVTAAYEHLTAVLADYLLRHDKRLDKADPRMQLLWRWHAAEETEHRAVAFDVYLALKGNHAWRVRWYTYAMLVFFFDAMRQTVLNLWHDGTLFKPSSWWSALKFFFGANGLIHRCAGPMLAYYKRDFHPDHEDGAASRPSTRLLAEQWLQQHSDQFRVVRPG